MQLTKLSFTLFFLTFATLILTAAEPAPLFQAKFDNGITANISANSSPARSYGTPSFHGSFADYAVLVNSADRLEYSLEGNWQQNEGTLIFYWAAQNWTPTAGNYVFGVSLSQKSGDDLLIYKLYDIPTLSFLLRNSDTKKSGNVRCDISSWKMNEYHQIAVTWNSQKVRCYIDAELQGEFNKFDFPDFEKLFVGTPYPSWIYLGQEASLIDELEILSVALNESELKTRLNFLLEAKKNEDALVQADFQREALLYVPFEKTFQAEKIPANVTIRNNFGAEPARYSKGIKGEALVLGGDNLPKLYFNAPDFPNSQEGSCLLWVKPEWSLSNKEAYFLLAFFSKDERLLLYKPHNTSKISLLVQNYKENQKPAIISSEIKDYQFGDWILFAFTWKQEQLNFYINAESVGAIPVKNYNWHSVVIGNTYNNWPNTGKEDTVFDELQIFDNSLNNNEIRNYYKKIIEKNPELNEAREEAKRQQSFNEKYNLALKNNGGMIIASSFADYTSANPDNLIDNDLSTSWRPFGNEKNDIFLELYFQYPRKINKLSFSAASKNRIAAAKVLIYNLLTDNFDLLKNVSSSELKNGIIEFPLQEVSRIRLLIESWENDEVPAISELGAYGPEQPIPGKNEPYWDAWYIWHNEINQTYYANEMRYLRTEFELDKLDFVSAVIQTRSNDYYKLWINDNFVDSEAVAIIPHQVGSLLRKGKNVIAAEVKVNRHPGQWGWGEFITELSINYPGNSRKISTGPDWVGSATEEKGWRDINFDSSNWKKVYCYTKPPQGPWGKIIYNDSSVRSRTELISSSIPSEVQNLGSAFKLEFRLKQHGNLAEDYFFIVEGGFPSIITRYNDYVFNRKIAECQNNNDDTVTVSCNFELPPWTPKSKQPLRLLGYNRNTGVKLEIDGLENDIVGHINIKEELPKQNSEGIAEMAYPKGQAAFVVDGKIMPPLMWRTVENSDPLRNYNEMHYGKIKIKNFIMYRNNIDHDPSGEKFELIFANLDRQIRTWLEINSSGKFIILPDLRPNEAWFRANPGNRLIDAFGKEASVVSFGSEIFYKACSDFLNRLVKRLKEQDYYSNLVGFMPWVCGAPDSVMGGTEKNTWQTDRKKLTVGDFHPAALEKFRVYLRDKYQNNPALLQKAWKQTDVNFQDATPKIEQLIATATGEEVLRDPAESGMMCFDYADFLPTLLGNFQRRLCAQIKNDTERKKMIFVHYGFIIAHMRGLNTPGGTLNNNNFDLPAWLADDNIDGYIGAPSYSHRFSGRPHLTYFPWSSFPLYNRMYLPDDDSRYFQCGTGNYGHNRSLTESRAVIRRNIGADITRNFGSWFSDMSAGNGRLGISWTGYKEISEEIGKMTELYAKAQKIGYRSAAEIAVVVSPESMKFLDVMYGSTLMNSLIAQMYYEEIFALGAPFDIYMQSDLSAPNFPREQYKLYFMLNSFSLSANDKEAINKIRATKDDTTWLWFYLPGYVDSERGNKLENIRELTGINVKKLPGKEVPAATFRSTPHPLLKNNIAASSYQMPLMPQVSQPMHPNELAPRLRIVDKDAEILAEFSDGDGALAIKNFENWRNVYSVVPYLKRDFLRNLAENSGVHIYTDANVVFDADGRYLVFNNGNERDQELNISLPRRASKISDALTGEILAQNTDNFVLKIEQTSTKIIFTEW